MFEPSRLKKLYRPLISIKRHYIKIILVLLLAGISIRPLLFTWNFLCAQFEIQIKGNRERGQIYLYKCLHYNPSAYLLSKIEHKVMTDSLVRFVVRRKNLEWLMKFSSPLLGIEDIKSLYQDNFYFQDLIDGLEEKRHWQYLDEVSFSLLEDASLNNETIRIIKTIGRHFSRDFVMNLVDFCLWRGNNELARFLVNKYDLPEIGKLNNIPRPMDTNRSNKRLLQIMARFFQEKTYGLGENILAGADFNDLRQFENHWLYLDMSGGKFSRGSFLMAPDQSHQTNFMRIMGFWVQEPGKETSPRGGIYYINRIPINRGVFLFSFDYLTRTKREKATLWLLWEGVGERHLPHSGGEWAKAILILDNRSFKHHYVRPMVRMWGTGTFCVDNIVLIPFDLKESRELPQALLIRKFGKAF